jgi:hypothetical protein
MDCNQAGESIKLKLVDKSGKASYITSWEKETLRPFIQNNSKDEFKKLTQSIGEKFDVKASITKKRREDGSNVIYYNMLSLNKTN